MELHRWLSSNRFTRLVLVVWLACAVSLFVIFKNVEQIVHVQLYEYGLQLSPAWLDPFRLYSTLIYYLCLGLPMVLTGLALVSSLLEARKVPGRKQTVPQRATPPTQAAKVAKAEPRPAIKEAPKKVESIKGEGICCPHCKKVFGRALVMLDFHDGKNQLVSVCPYCSNVLENTSEEKNVNWDIHVKTPDEKIVH